MNNGQTTVESLLESMRLMQAIPQPRPAIVQCLLRDKDSLMRTIHRSDSVVAEFIGIPFYFYNDEGEMAEDAFRKINDGISVFQIKS